MMRRLHAIAGPLTLLLIVSGFFWKLLTKQFTWMDHPDMAYQVLPWYQFQAVAWHRGEFPLWDPRVWAGQPLVGQLQPGAAYPLNWLLFVAPLKDGRIQPLWLNLFFILTHFCAALFGYWLCRDLKRSRAGSVFAGAAFALTGVVGNVAWPQMLNGAIWLPLVLLFFLRSTREERPFASAAFCGTFVGVSFLSGHHQIPTFIALMAGCLWAVEIWRRRTRALIPFAMFALFAALFSALQVLPAYEYGVRSIRWVGSVNPVFWGQSVPYSVHQQASHSLFPLAVLGLVLPSVTPHDVFVGLTVLTFALLGLALSYRERDVRTLGAIGAGGLLFAFGGFSVFHGVMYLLVPMVEKARTPAMAVVLVQFAIAVLAAYGLDALRTRAFGPWWIPALTAVGILPWPVLVVASSVRAETSREYEHLAVLGLVGLAVAAILYGCKRKALSGSAAVVLAFVVALFEIGTVTGTNFRHRDQPGGSLAVLKDNRDVVDFLRKQPDFVRLEVDTDAVPYNIGDWDGIDQFRAYLGGMTTNVAQFEKDRLRGGRLAPRLFSLTHFAGREPLRPGQELVFRGKSGVNIYRNPEAFPHVWVAHSALSTSRRELMSRLRSVDVAREVVLTEPAPTLDACRGPDEARVIRRDDSRVTVFANLACKGMLILSETWFPGWDATLDGAPARTYEAYGALRGVVVPGGEHRIEFVYRPFSVYIGAMLTGAGVIAALLMAMLPLRARRESYISNAHIEADSDQPEKADAPRIESNFHQKPVDDSRINNSNAAVDAGAAQPDRQPSKQQDQTRTAQP